MLWEMVLQTYHSLPAAVKSVKSGKPVKTAKMAKKIGNDGFKKTSIEKRSFLKAKSKSGTPPEN